MAMRVETYEVAEVDSAGLSVENTQESLQLIEQLGLTGQAGLCQSMDGQTAYFPYREMTDHEMNVYKTVCPERSKLEKFSCSIIPVRVLKVAAFAKELFKELEVWSAGGQDRDPLLVGVRQGNASWEHTYFLLARWGEELDSFNTLVKRAVTIKRASIKAGLAQAKAKMAQYEQSLSSLTDEDIVKAGEPRFYE